MHADAGTDRETLAKQAELFRLAERDYGLSLAVLAAETGISIDTLKSYNRSNPFARAKMPLHAFVTLCRVIPDDVTSLVFERAGKCIGTCGTDDGDLDALERESAGFVAASLEAKADGVVTPIERGKLKDRARRVASRARAVAA